MADPWEGESMSFVVRLIVLTTSFDFKKDQYPLSKIKNARVKANTIKDHLIRILTIGFIVSSVVWMICPQSLGVITGPISIIIGSLMWTRYAWYSTGRTSSPIPTKKTLRSLSRR